MQGSTAGAGHTAQATGGSDHSAATAEAVGTLQQTYRHRQKLEQEVEQEKVDLARSSFRHFVEFVIRDSHTGEPVICSDIHVSWCDHIHDYLPTEYDIGILSMWGHGKSTLVAVALPLWLIGQNPNYRIGIICNSDGNASKRVRAIGEYVKSSEEYHRVFPHVRQGRNKTWNEHRLEVERAVIAPEGTVEAFGIDAMGTGSRFDLMVYDDPADQKDADSESIRKSRIEKFNNVWGSRIEPGGKSFYIATRWHKADLTHEVLQRGNWRFKVQAISESFDEVIEPPPDYIRYPAVVGKDSPRTIPLWEGKWPERILKGKADSLGGRAFNRGFRQKPYSSEDTLFSEEHVLAACKWYVTVSEAAPLEWPRYLGADLSSSSRPGTVIVVIAREPKTGRKVVVDVDRGTWGWSSRSAHRIYNMFTKHNCKLGYVENNVAQEIMLELIRVLHRTDVAIKGFTTGKQKADPFEGLPGLAVEFENSIWSVPLRHVSTERKKIESSTVPVVVLVKELLEYPHGAASDCVMALWFADAASKVGLGLGFPGLYQSSGPGRIFGGRSAIFGSGYKGDKAFTSG